MSDETALVKASETNLRLVALDPAQLQRSQQQLIAWTTQKIATVQDEVKSFEENLEICKKAKWNTARPKAHLARAKGRLVYYEKLKAALEAGYYIVPDMPCDIFAIRTDRIVPTKQQIQTDYSHAWHQIQDEKPKLLPSGEGDYQNPDVPAHRRGPMKYLQDGKEKVSYAYTTDEAFNEIAFPFSLAKPQILDATQRAMALKIFDEIGVAPAQRKRDPMVLGIIKQRKEGWQAPKQLTFLIAWFLDTEVL